MLIEELSKRARVNSAELKQQVQSAAPAIVAATPEAPAKIKIAAPLRLALALLVQNPSLATVLDGSLPDNIMPGFAFFLQLLEMLKQNPHIPTGTLLEHWRDKKEENAIIKLANWQHMIPEEGVKEEFLGAIRQLKVLVYDTEINRLLAKATQEGLSAAEKALLSSWIAQKKAIA
jgi:DNA primase